jgi:hypothetical protein
MIASLLDLARFFERAGQPHELREEPPAVEITSPDGRLTLCWDTVAGRIYAVRWDDDEVRASLRLSIPTAADGSISEQAIVRLIAAAMPGSRASVPA